MKRFAAMMGLYLIILLYLFVTLENVGCRFDRSGLPPSQPPAPQNYQNCTAKIKDCDKNTAQLEIKVSGPSPYNIAGAYQVDSAFEVDDKLYINEDQPWLVQAIELPALRGGIFVRTDHEHRTVTAADFLHLRATDSKNVEDLYVNVKDLYVAYDSRANPKPQWLTNTQDWERVNKASGQPNYIVTSMPDKSKKPLQPVNLEIYRRKQMPTNVQPGASFMTLPGNNCSLPATPPGAGCTGTPGWPGVSDKNRAMYIVIVTRKDVPDCSKGTIDEQNKYEGCKADEAGAKKEATDKCNQALKARAAAKGLNPAFFQCQPPTCEQLTLCPKKSGLIQNRSYPVSSVVEFEPSKHKSEANIKVHGKKFTKKVEGKLYFEYLLDEFDAMKNMRIDGMNLDIEPVDSDAGKFTNIVVMLRETARASCQDATPPYAGNQPCNKYRVPTGGFKAFLSTQEGGETLLFDPVNKGNVDIQIDHKNRTFQIKGGPLSADVQVNGKSVPLDIDIDLFGHFLNFAPHAVGRKESTKWVECRWSDQNNFRSNRDPIILNSAGSFETYNDPIPQKAYEWFEDYTWPPQKKWGTGSKFTIKPHEMSFGVHEMTLLIRDDFGISDTDTFDVAVRDTQPPKITVPPDVHRLVIPPEKPPVKLYIGQASAIDECFHKDVAITNDAPQDRRFPEGVTPVTWTAEDGAGNAATGTQKVIVYRVVDKRDPKAVVPKVKELLGYTAEEIQQVQATANRCDPLELRAMNPRALADRTKQMADLIEGLSPRPERMEQRERRVHLLRQGEEQLGEADHLIARARTAERAEARRDFCAAAATSLGDAGKAITGAVALPELPPGPPEPPPGAEARCEEYARHAARQGEENLRRECGFRGPAWNDDFGYHARLCRSMPWAASQGALEEREYLLQRCLAAHAEPPERPEPGPPPETPPFEPPPPAAEGPERCREYAHVAVALSQENVRQRCGFTGRRWLVDLDEHFRWCLSAPRELSEAETRAREEQLGRCPRPPAAEPPPPGRPEPPPPFVPVAPIEPPPPPPPGRPEPPPVFPAWPIAPPPPPPPPIEPPPPPPPLPVFPAHPIPPPPPPPRPPSVPVYPVKPIPPPPAKPAPPPIPVYPARPLPPPPVIE